MIYSPCDRGVDTEIRVNGRLLGGVVKAVVITDNNNRLIYEYLSADPVKAVKSTGYRIRLTAEGKPDRAFFGEGLELCLGNGNERTVYSDCNVIKLESFITPENKEVYKVIIASRECDHGDGNDDNDGS